MFLTMMEVVIRLTAAAALGGAIGIDRELQQKPAGFRTHAMVSLGSALLTLVGLGLAVDDNAAISRVLQGLIAGIGFVGGGAILRTNGSGNVQGLTTATSLWVVAAIGITTGLGMWAAAVTTTVLALVLLSAGERFDRWLRRLARIRDAQ